MMVTPNCLSLLSSLSSFHMSRPIISATGPLGEYEHTKPFHQFAADGDATWHDAQITLPRNVGTAIPAELQAMTEHVYRYVRNAGRYSPC